MITPTMSAEAAEKLRKVNEAATDWEATCPKCGAKLSGTLEQLRQHRHKVEELR